MESESSASPPKMPTWVKVFIAIGVVGVVTVVAVVALVGGEHGPSRHFGNVDSSEHVGMTHEPGHTMPSSHHAIPEPQPRADGGSAAT